MGGARVSEQLDPTIAQDLELERGERAQRLAREETDRAVALAEKRGREAGRTDARLDSIEERLDDLEDKQQRGHEWKRGPLLMAGAGLVFTIVNLLPTLLHT
jgi:Flp pilus assembly protein TadB